MALMLFYIMLGAFLFLTGIKSVTNIRIVWLDPLTGLAALIAGIICLFMAFSVYGVR